MKTANKGHDEIVWPTAADEQHRIWNAVGRLQRRWPYGPPAFHEPCCRLHVGPGRCDCKASDESDTEWGMT
jgi:hypothetical protein